MFAFPSTSPCVAPAAPHVKPELPRHAQPPLHASRASGLALDACHRHTGRMAAVGAAYGGRHGGTVVNRSVGRRSVAGGRLGAAVESAWRLVRTTVDSAQRLRRGGDRRGGPWTVPLCGCGAVDSATLWCDPRWSVGRQSAICGGQAGQCGGRHGTAVRSARRSSRRGGRCGTQWMVRQPARSGRCGA